MITEEVSAAPDLRGVRILAALHGLELFGHERGNIEVYEVLRELGAEIRIAVNARENGGEVAEYLTRLGFDVFPVPFGPQWSWQWVKKEGFKFVISQFGKLYKSSRVFHRQLVDFQPTHIHLGSTLAYSFISLALLRCGTPLVWRMGDCPPTDSPFNLRIWKMAMRRAQQTVCISDFVGNTATACGVAAHKITRIYNLAPRVRASVKQQGMLPSATPGEIRLLYMGAVSEHKGLLPLVAAFAKCFEVMPELRLSIVGGSRWDGAFREVIERKIAALDLSHVVSLVGHVEAPAAWYAGASVHLAPSICEEGLGNVVLEAKRASCPSVVFPSGGLPEMIRHQIDGFICHDKSAEALEEGIRWMLGDPERLAQMRENARADFDTRFGAERFRQQWAEVYREAAKSNDESR